MLGIYGGTFDPVHYGHLRSALEVKEALGIADFRFLPCRTPPHRGLPGANPAQRLEMLELALQHAGEGFSVDLREFYRDGPSYMVDTLKSLRKEEPTRAICLILGLDAFSSLPSWNRWRQLFDLAHIAVVRRPDSQAPAWKGSLADILRLRQEKDPGMLQATPNGKIIFLEITQLAISATRIRNLVAKGRSPRYLLPDAVLAMILSQRLYQAPDTGAENQS